MPGVFGGAFCGVAGMLGATCEQARPNQGNASIPRRTQRRHTTRFINVSPSGRRGGNGPRKRQDGVLTFIGDVLSGVKRDMPILPKLAKIGMTAIIWVE